MELRVKTSDLVKEVQLVYGIIEKKATIPILSNILIEAKEKKLFMTATNIEVTLKSQCPADIHSEGSITISGQRFFDCVRFLPPESEIFMKLNENNWAMIECERTKYRIAGISSEEFPSIKKAEESAIIQIPWEKFKRMINKVFFAISAEETRYALKGALVMIEPGEMILVATDGHRLAYIKSRKKGDIKAEKSFRAVINRKALQELMKIGEEKDLLSMKEMENHIYFKMAGRELISSIVEGEFPDYEKVIGEKNGKTMKIATQDFMDALKRVSLFSNERLGGIIINIEPGKMEISASSAEQGEAQETIGIDYQGEKMKISYNARYIMEFLNVVGSEMTRMEISDEDNKAILRPMNEEQTEYLYIVMPMTL